MLKPNFRRQGGITIIELMVGIAVGLIVVSAAIAVFVGNLRGSSDNLRQVRLGEELNAAMAFMANDIRRAGYWGAAKSGMENPFAVADTNITINGSCILYSYDAVYSTAYGSADNGDFFGFKLDNGSGILQMRNASTTAHNNSSCSASDDTWANLTDPSAVFVDTLTFSYEGSNCLDTSMTSGTNTAVSAANATSPPCPSTSTGTGTAFANAGHLLVESRVIRITLTGHHAADPTVTKTLTSTVAVRNDRMVQL